VPGVSATGSVDRRLTQAAEDAGVLPKGASPHGKTAAETKEAQKPHLLHKLGTTGAEVAAHSLSIALEGASGVGAGVAAALLGPGTTLLTLLVAFEKAHAEGDELAEANRRDRVNGAFVMLASAALPPAYVAKMRVELGATDWGLSNKILTPLQANNAEWEAVKKQAEEHVRIGRDSATRLGVTSNDALEARLKGDRRFAALYQQNLGFKHGVDSVIHDGVQRQLYGK
jgi:hypothetical protein